MKLSKWIMAFLAGGAMLVAAGCEQEQSMTEVGTPGAPIVFTAATSYVNGNGTRTEYSGVVYGDDNKIERIDWVPNTDKFTVNYQHGSTGESADFLVTSASEDTYNSNASVTAISDRLVWAEGTDHRFYAMYPSHAMNDKGTLTGNAFSATLYPAQNQTHMQEVTVNASTGTGTYTYNRYLPDMGYAYMVAYAPSQSGDISGNGVTLRFRPAVTTFEFRLRRNAGESGARVKRFILSSSEQALTGDFTFSITGGDERGATWGTVTVPARTTANSAIIVDFTENDATGVELPSETDTKYLDFTVFALPVDITGLTIRIEYMDDSARVLPLKDKNAIGELGDWHTFTGAKKYVFTNSHVPGDDDYTYHIDNLSCEEMDGMGIIYVDTDALGAAASAPVQFDTYKKSRSGGKIYVPIGKVEYSASPDGGWAEWGDSGRPSAFADEFSPSKVTTDGIRDKADASMSAFDPGTEIHTEEIDAGQYHTAILRSRSVVGTSSAPRDLSLYTTDGKARSGNKRVTANCYVVGNPGWFKFPLVYGNAIDQVKIAGEGVNTDAFNPGALSTSRFMQNFQNYLGEGISSPYVLDDTGLTADQVEARIVWSDAGPNAGEATGHEVEQITNDDLEVLSDDHGYIRLFLDRTKIHQGNILIALRKKSDQTILWSWHIWVSDLAMKAVRMSNENTQVSTTPVRAYTDFLQYNIGWCEEGMTKIHSYSREPYYVRVTQVDEFGNHEVQVFKVIERGGVEVDAAMSSGTYYQWGRKDPFLPSSGQVETSSVRVVNPVSKSGNKPFYSPSGYQINHDDVTITFPDVIDETTGQPVSYNRKDKALNYQTPTDAQMGESIQHPYVVYNDDHNWRAGTYRLENNLWDAKMTVGNTDKIPCKTVYDPCPPGYVVPNRLAFLNFNGKGEDDTYELNTDGTIYDGFKYFNVIDLNGDGEISEKDFERGFYFKKTGASLDRPTTSGRTNGLFFPAAGYRLSGPFTKDTYLESDVYEMGLEGWYWTTCPYDGLGIEFLFTTHVLHAGTSGGTGEGGRITQGFNMQYNANGNSWVLSIRPMVDE